MLTAIRSPTAEDRPLILDSWLKSFLGLSRSRPNGFGERAQIPRAHYFHGQERLIESILRHPDTRVLVATLPDTTDHPVSWICGNPEYNQLHFLYTFSTWRREGLATRLMETMFGADFRQYPVIATHWTRVLPCYYRKWGLIYDPYALFDMKGDPKWVAD